MKTIIAGSRTIKDKETVFDIIDNSFIKPTSVLCGMAYGVDWIGKLWAEQHNIEWFAYLPKWEELGKVAGHVRNQDMANDADAAIIIWDGKSKGTMDMFNRAQKMKLIVDFYDLSQPRLFL